jgi:hypothetical protein
LCRGLHLSIGYGSNCRAESDQNALTIYVDGYPDVDRVVQRLGAFLRDQRRGDSFVIRFAAGVVVGD